MTEKLSYYDVQLIKKKLNDVEKLLNQIKKIVDH